ncbi:Methyltransferase domain-containing protein [Actinacidiphila yanglinensis]|uniref:Methyltransferase domain-containing protein n=1 Tax=Actinacidiphila yanglinensis TaxID=310779 RepID=A0A1H6DDA5_9ACTN|nr:class I SAM-dependent methyltransferase [Actinacidiphila yanglinensis]SEG82803.1 Methyltransferase domain-containing protein [Actinacidiphila yanglinensis]
MYEVSSELAAVHAAMGARARLRQWAYGGQVVDLLRSAAAAKWLDALTVPTTLEELASTSGVSTERAHRVIEVFLAAGVARTWDDSSSVFVLTEEFAALHGSPSGVRLDDAIDEIAAARERVRSAVWPAARHDWERDALVVARHWGMAPTAASRAIFAMAFGSVPEYRDRLSAGGPLLDVGSGVGGALLAGLTLYPELRAVGVERAGDVVDELRERAEAAGVTSRLEIRQIDAQGIVDEAVYEVAYWAQAFFPRDARAATLAAVRRALVPGGLLLVQELLPPVQETPDTRLSAALDALVAESRGVPPVRTAEELATELRNADFDDVQVTVTPVGRLVVGRRGD